VAEDFGVNGLEDKGANATTHCAIPLSVRRSFQETPQTGLSAPMSIRSRPLCGGDMRGLHGVAGEAVDFDSAVRLSCLARVPLGFHTAKPDTFGKVGADAVR
jgi:hypothetical protein|tara:strand:- start:227 stop:532 length:306 start_codon:yes stop_codon:yes gene_type:complete